MAVVLNPASSGIGGSGSSSGTTTTTALTIPAPGTRIALRASQASYGNLIDQGPAQNVLNTNTGLFPVGYLNGGSVNVGDYRTPTVMNGLLYKCTTAGVNGSSEPTWNTTIGGTTSTTGSGGTAVYTTEKGPYTVDGSGAKLFRSIASSQTGVASTFGLAAATFNWDLQKGDSLIVNMRIKQDWNASGQAAASPILSTSVGGLGAANRGFMVLATGSTLQDLRFRIADGTTEIISDDTSAGYPFKPLDGTQRDCTMMIDGALKMMYFYINGVGLAQSDMFNTSTGKCPNGMNLGALTGSTAGGILTIGGNPGSATSFECAFKCIDVTVLSATALPANIQNIASWYARGGEGVIPAALLS